MTSTNTNPTEELENYLCSIDYSNHSQRAASAPPVHIEFESFISPRSPSTRSAHVNMSNEEQLIVYAAPVIQMQLTSRCKETIERLKEIKKEKSILLAVINPSVSKHVPKTSDDLQQ